ncbi:MAG TPA: endonuclease/exonuclease/phosphatase family protein [Xanthomonadaceae bacterium]|nr:endonuclease/exonuclease/phosphatase family protein [Xanthomonadaceae bacterium]
MSAAIRIATYNVLADAYLEPAWYAHIEPAALDPCTRREGLAARIAGLEADVACLQEVEPERFDYLQKALAPLGYTGVFAQKRRGRPDGCAVFLRPLRARLVHSEAFHYLDAEAGGEDSGHLALICEIECALGRLQVAGTHLRWASDETGFAAHVGWRQVRQLLDARVGSDPQRWVICGDLNGTVESAPLRELLDRGWIDAYRAAPQPTCNPNRRAKRIDYLLHSPDLRSVPDPLADIDDGSVLPSRREPSDHLPLVATFTLD